LEFGELKFCELKFGEMKGRLPIAGRRKLNNTTMNEVPNYGLEDVNGRLSARIRNHSPMYMSVVIHEIKQFFPLPVLAFGF